MLALLQGCAIFFAGGPISNFLNICGPVKVRNSYCFWAQLNVETVAGGSVHHVGDEDLFFEINGLKKTFLPNFLNFASEDLF